MISAGIVFLIGIVGLQQCVELPHPAWLLLLPFVLFLALSVQRFRLLWILLCGFLWALLHAVATIQINLPASLEGVDLVLEGDIVSIPQRFGDHNRFEFKITQAFQLTAGPENKLQLDTTMPLPMRVRLDWYGVHEPLFAGDRWRMLVRLKSPHGFMNPGGFDYEGWLFAQGINATGYVKRSENNRRLMQNTTGVSLTALRHRVVHALQAQLQNLKYPGILIALAVGDRQMIHTEQWELLASTGTSHLVAISGLHIGLVAGLMFIVGTFIWRLSVRLWPALGVRISAKSFASVLALISALIYGALAGFSLPTVRALIMLVVVLLGFLLKREMRPFSALMLALFLVLLIDPFAVNTPGFWLSFLAVAVLIFIGSDRPHQHLGFSRWPHIQLTLTLALLPVTLVWFQRAALSGALANVIAIPLIAMLVVPLTLAGTLLLFLFKPLAIYLFRFADFLLEQVFFPLLSGFSEWPLSQWMQASPPLWTWIPAVVGILLLIAPKGFPARWLAVVLLMPLFLALPDKPKEGEVWFSLLDVGQGLAAVIQTHSHVLVYDTGPQFSEDFDTGRAVVLPFLRQQGIKHFDKLMISHADKDHAGGVLSLTKVIMPAEILSSDPAYFAAGGLKVKNCHGLAGWVWEGVTFEILHPQDRVYKGRNNNSCVLKVSSAGGSVLLPGDIESEAEYGLLAEGMDLKADILLVPHHGSRTSSTEAFIKAVKPRYALFATGYRNRYGFPKVDIVERYRREGAQALISYQQGALLFRLKKGGGINPISYRSEVQRYWHHRAE